MDSPQLDERSNKLIDMLIEKTNNLLIKSYAGDLKELLDKLYRNVQKEGGISHPKEYQGTIELIQGKCKITIKVSSENMTSECYSKLEPLPDKMECTSHDTIVGSIYRQFNVSNSVHLMENIKDIITNMSKIIYSRVSTNIDNQNISISIAFVRYLTTNKENSKACELRKYNNIVTFDDGEFAFTIFHLDDLDKRIEENNLYSYKKHARTYFGDNISYNRGCYI